MQFAAVSIGILAFLWIFMMLSAGLAMGWSGRSNIAIAALLIFGLLAPTLLTIALSGKAISFARQERLGRSTAFLFAALMPIPFFYLFEVWRWI